MRLDHLLSKENRISGSWYKNPMVGRMETFGRQVVVLFTFQCIIYTECTFKTKQCKISNDDRVRYEEKPEIEIKDFRNPKRKRRQRSSVRVKNFNINTQFFIIQEIQTKKTLKDRLSYKERRENDLASGADEGRDKLR